jgi:hypothetical protein
MCNYIYIYIYIYIIEHNGAVSPENLIVFPTDPVYAFVSHCDCLSVGQYTCLSVRQYTCFT